ncbi:MAG TPA: PilC/PilY family type IV pilus protein [Syntrophales bacterium]|nr:PilC/PilY family type IV pilus protein [Syntrophales bacterium]
MGRIFRNIVTVIILLFLTISTSIVKSTYADEADIFLANLKPNVLIILDNSNSMDEDFVGNAICSWATGSRSVEGRRQLLNVVNANANNMRIGLMSFRLPAASKWYLHNGPYFVSYNSKSWCPTPPAEPGCVDYCVTGNVASKNTCNSACQVGNPSFNADYSMSDINGSDGLTAFAAGSEPRNRYCNLTYPKTNRIVNPSDGANYVYYNIPGTFYDSQNDGNGFCHASSYTADDSWSSDSYSCYYTKTSNNDDNANYSGNWYNGQLAPTDEDIALGFHEFGRRIFWYPTGQTWFANSSPGDGYLHVACADNTANNSQLNALTAKLAMHENDPVGYMSCTNTGNPNACTYIVNAGLTPTEGTFQSAVNYFQGGTDYQSGVAYTSPVQAWCQKNFIIFVTDGLPDTNAAGGNDSAVNEIPGVLAQMDTLRTLTVPSITGYTFDINTYVLGMALTDQAKVQLDAMAVHGGTADANGHAYYADNPTQLAAALAAIPADIISKTYSFTVASVSSSRITDENYLYEASFSPVNGDPFWRGYLKKYNINADGTLGYVLWEAGSILAGRNYSTRNIYTSSNGSLITFDTSIPSTSFGVATNAQRDAIVGYVQGNPAYNPDGWKLGDTFHSNPVNVGTPNPFFEDTRDTNYTYTCNSVVTNAFGKFRCDNTRTSANGLRLIVAGANDGQFHAFKTSDGSEQWSFIPPNLLPQLQYLAHTTNPSTLAHEYFVDGPVTVADVWWKSAGGTADGTSKVNSDWHTLAILGEGNGGVPTGSYYAQIWSSNSQCDGNYQTTYDSTYPYYCGYYAFDLTNNAAIPSSYYWHLGGSTQISATDGPYLGAPWSKMMVGRVRYNSGGQEYEKWVGFIGGGYNISDCSGGGACGVCDCRGKGFYVVDLSNGHILWSYTYGDDANMKYSIPAAPAIVDTDQDGFVDTVYVGDMGGNMWRFNFCRAADMLAPPAQLNSCGISGQTVNWAGGRLYRSATVQPIFQSAAVSLDDQQNLWVYWGTGNKEMPKDATTGDTVFGVKDNDRSTTYASSNLKNISTAGQAYNPGDSQDGFYINLPGTGEKMLADPTVFGGVVYFTSYTPPTGSGDLCLQGGTSSLYALNYTSGDGAFGSSARSMSLGAGIASSPMLSMKPGASTIPDIYVTVSGGGGVSASTQRVNFNPPGISNRVNILNWRDRRIQ